ncbi:LysR family transcriptional regulator [Asanoa ishikariensis]|uniref:ModE molybdate transport repressor domain-containing protein n=1 Tax=Asanoa ishikariensis TaxID=137265 RepID=A0A1H3UHK1_9ACTN|nr:LysR family transcriptional regulator [Asanoa ishikariensis]GIF63526.1 LysR family transcriptional regulator [Asanoa ishikariensis]SDZ61777.1 ModE molybdate transport repressor domain-containing protein [Asanoa ishikariensis]
MRLDPGQLRLLALIDRHGSLSAAAGALGITAAAVTQQVARTERACGASLVRRGPRGASLTSAGALLAAHGQVIDEQTREAGAGLAALLGELSLRLRIGGFQAAALRLLPPALTALRHRHPDADLSVVDIGSEEGIPLVAAGDLDLAVIAAWDEVLTAPEHVRLHPLLTDPMVVVLPEDHPLAAGTGPLRLERLRDEAWVTIIAGHAARAQFDRATAAAGFTPRVRFQTASYDVAQALVGTGIGVALVSRLTLGLAPGTVHRELARGGLHRRIYAATLTDTTPTPLVDAFLHLLHDVVRDLQ